MSSSGFVASNLIAVGTTQAVGLQLGSHATLHQFSGSTLAHNACRLPLLPSNGELCKVRNVGAAALNVYPQVGGSINGLTVNTAYIVPTGAVVTSISTGSLSWPVLDGHLFR